MKNSFLKLIKYKYNSLFLPQVYIRPRSPGIESSKDQSYENQINATRKGDLSSLKSAQSRKILQHVLSPLEEAAFHHIYKPFDYEIEKGKNIYITHYTCKELLRSTAHKLDLLLNSATKSIYFNRVPVKHRKAFDDVRIVLSLYPILRNKLCRLDCFTLLSIMKQGRKYFSEEQKFGKGEMRTIDKLFAKYNCSHLF